MKLKFILFLFPFLSTTQSFAIDVGDGSDGICDEVTIAATLKNYYQCTSLDINGALSVFKAGAAGANVGTVVIKVQNDVTVTGSIDLSGANGINGNTISVVGGAAGAGGGAGGNSTAIVANNNGFGNGAGTAGAFAGAGLATSYGGGGGGASFGTLIGAVATNGSDDGGAVAKGTNGSTYYPEINFETNFSGGSGGGAGGSGYSQPGSILMFGSSGGGGGGAIRIIAGGNITITGTIISTGGNGGGTAAIISSGGGGGGSGGAIWIQAAGVMDVTGATITAAGGTGGVNDSFGIFDYGLGGSGGKGRIRLDDADGVIAGIAGINNPSAVTSIFTPTALSSATSRQYTSAVACGRVSLNDQRPFNNLINLIFGMMISSLVYLSVHFWLSRKGKV